jgi:hypothetical protein
MSFVGRGWSTLVRIDSGATRATPYHVRAEAAEAWGGATCDGRGCAARGPQPAGKPFGEPGRSVGLAARARLRRCRGREERGARRRLDISSARRDGSDGARAEALLGARQPLVCVFRRFDTAFEQLVSVSAMQGAALVFLSGNLRFGLSLVIAGLVVQVGLGCRLAALRARRRELCLELIIGGRQALPLACTQRERRRLLDPRTRQQLATSTDEILQTAAGALPLHPAVRPIFYARVIRHVAPGVAAVEWLLRAPASPLYDVHVEPLRQELGRARYLLNLTP